MKKITILALHLGYGGVEKCISSLANSLCNDYKINIVSTYKLYDKPAFNINENINVEYLIEDLKPNRKEINESLKKHKYITFIKEVIKAIKILKMKKKLMINYIKNCDSDIIISTREIHNLWTSKYAKKGITKIGWEHSHHNNNEKYIDKLVKSVKNLDYFILVSSSLEQFYSEKLKDSKCKTIYIPNSLDEYPTKYSSLEEKNILSVGRLSLEKGYSDLIDVFKLVHDIYPDWKLNIVGDGSEYSSIEKKIIKNNLSSSIELYGYRDRLYINELLLHSSIYAMASFSESFGIVLLEAFSYGIPCVAFDRAVGASEIISDNWDGYLIKDSDKEKMAKRICELISNINRRVIMGANGIKKADKYNINEIKKEWIKIIEK